MQLTVLEAEIYKRPQPRDRGDWKGYNKAPRVYVTPAGESVIDNLMNRRNRPISLFKDLAERALTEAGITHPKLRWNQYAGCSCPCSPGFVLADYVNSDWQATNSGRFDFYVTVGEPTVEMMPYFGA